LLRIWSAIRESFRGRQRVFCVLNIPEQAQRSMKQRTPVPTEQRLHRLRVDTLSSASQLLLIKLASRQLRVSQRCSRCYSLGRHRRPLFTLEIFIRVTKFS
jgi:hypothetical protein